MKYSRSWYRLYVVLKGPHLHFYSDQVAYKTGLHKEQPLYLPGGTADNAPDYDKKKYVFRIRFVTDCVKNTHGGRPRNPDPPTIFKQDWTPLNFIDKVQTTSP